MYNTLWNLPVGSPRLAWEGLQMILSLSTPNPAQTLRTTERWGISPADTVTVLEQSSVRPACAMIRDEILGTFVLLSGTQGTLHIAQLLAGWLNPGGAIRASGANPAFENAALDILASVPVGAIDLQGRVRIFGYSYGGATGQVMADELCNNLRNNFVECVSFGSPRTGNIDFQARMSRIPNVRYFSDDDPVRFMPPHVDEIPAVLFYLGGSLVTGMDTQIHSPSGRQLEANGNIAITEGEPTRLHAVVPSIIDWVCDINGFQSVNHSQQNYLTRLATAITREVVPATTPASTFQALPMILNVGNAAYWEDQAEQDVTASPQMTLPVGQSVTITRLDATRPSRYKRKKQGGIWTVQLDSLVVAVGPGKRRAGQLARSMNRAALVR